MAAAPENPIDLYYWNTPNGWKASIMLEECGLPYTVHPVNIGKGEQFKPEFLAISPNNKIPAIVRDQRQIAYGVRRYTDETHRLYGVMDRRLAERDYLAGDYSIADMAAWPWVLPELQGQDLAEFPNLAAWMDRVGARPAVIAGRALGDDLRRNLAASGKAAEAARKVLFGQRGR